MSHIQTARATHGRAQAIANAGERVGAATAYAMFLGSIAFTAALAFGLVG